MFAGVRGRGAEEANFLHALELEEHLLLGTFFAGGDVDIKKCFDQLVRPLVVALAAAAGMPTGVLRAYTSYMD
eukprot:434268-Lingulodinium_polyedra.AAC.1